LQVGLARMEYLYPRLANSYTELSRQRGGNKNKGQGETQIEVDRRLIQDRIQRFKLMIEEVRVQRNLTRKSRTQQGTPSIALVGYTNAGKSSMHRSLCGSDAYVADALFATLDPTARQCELPGKKTVVMVDTVGFIRKLPHGLVDAFKATLEEAVYADVLIHVLDASSPWAGAHYQATLEVLAEIGAKDIPMILALNKIDQLENWHDIKEYFAARHQGPVVGVSAVSKAGLPELLETLEQVLHADSTVCTVKFGYGDGKTLAWLYAAGAVLERIEEDDGSLLTLRLNSEQFSRLTNAGFAFLSS
jgi:GTPase